MTGLLTFRQKIYDKKKIKPGKQLINTLTFIDVLFKCILDDQNHNCLLKCSKRHENKSSLNPDVNMKLLLMQNIK